MEKTLTIAGYTCQTIHNKAHGTPIVLLHGLSYTSKVWQSIKLTELLIEKQIPFLAIDMPYGIKTQCTPRTRNPQKNLEVIHETIKTMLDSAVPVLVGASIGGNMALHYASQYSVKGLLLIAPARALEKNLTQSYNRFNFPTTIIWGTEDNIISSEDMRTLTSKLPKTKLIIYEGASHSAYKDQPERFKHDLMELYAKTEQA